MTDNDIIKALECCTDESYENCNECPYSIDAERCERMKLLEDILDLINHQKAEIERLKKEIQTTKDAYIMLQTKNEIIKSEAVKECLAKVKNYIKTHCNPYGKPDFDYDTSIKILNFIDNLVKEMTEKNNDFKEV